MKNLMINFSERLKEIGFINDEIPYLIEDLIIYFGKKNCSLHHLNYEMEDLGWGYQIIDQGLYKDLCSYLKNGHNFNSVDKDM